MSKSEIVYRKLRHFAEVGQAFALTESEVLKVWEMMRRKRNGKEFKFKKMPDGNYLIWRTK